MIARLLALAGAIQVATGGTSLTLGEIEAHVRAGTAMALAPRILPSAIAARVVAGRAGRLWSPGQVYRIAFRENARVKGRDLCLREGHAIEASAPEASGDKAPAETRLTLGPVRSWTEVAVLRPGHRATAKECEAAAYIPASHDPARRTAAYRVLAAAMSTARGERPLPFALSCRAGGTGACLDARKALRTLPMSALLDIQVSCLDTQRMRTGKFTTCPALTPGQPYEAEVSFGPSGDDGHSWRVAFIHRPGWPEEVALSRTLVIHH